MKKIMPIIIILLLFCVTCKDNEPTAPEEETPTEVLTETTIGSGGGSLTTDDFTLTVPEGAFVANADIKLYEETENQFGTNSVSPLFRIVGIPDNYQLPLQISIKYSGTLSGESAIAVGEDTYVPSLDSNFVVYDFLETTESGGTLTCELEVPTSNTIKKTAESEAERWLNALTKGSKKETSHFSFEIFSNNLSNQQGIALEDFLEQLYTKYENLGFDYTRSDWPVNVIIKNIMYEFSAYYRYGDNYPTLVFNIPLGVNIPDNYRKIDNIYAWLISSMYSNDRGKWMNWAFTEWVNINYDDLGNYGSDNFRTATQWVFGGFENIVQTPGKHGIVMALVLEYLVNNYGEGIWSHIYDKIGNGTHPIKAIFETTASPWEWLHDFHRYMIEDSTFTEMSDDFWVTNSEKEITISNTNKEEDITHSYYDLSAKWYKINFGTDLPDNTDLTIEAYSNDVAAPDLSIYQFKGSNLEWLGSSDDGEIEIEDIKAYAEDGYGLIALVTNGNAVDPYTNQSEIVLVVKLIEEDVGIEKGGVRVQTIDGHFVTVFSSGNTTTQDREFHIQPLHKEGDFSNNEFTSSYDFTDTVNNVHYSGTCEILLNDSKNSVIFCSHQQVETHTDYLGQTDVYTKKIEGKNIPLTEDNIYGMEYAIYGAQLVDHVTLLKYKKEHFSASGELFHTQTLESHEFNNVNCAIIVRLSKKQ